MLRLRNYWYIAAPGDELRSHPLHRDVEGESLVLFRDSGGVAHALVDRCAHRGMALSEGRVQGDCIECPYHGWRYSGAGDLTCIPALCEGERAPKPGSMRSYPVIEQDGHIGVWLDREEPDHEPFHFPFAGESGWQTFFMHTRFEAPVDACLENFLDVPHTLFVHPGLFRSQASRPTRARVRCFQDSVEAEFLEEAPLQGIGPRLMFPRGTVMKHTDRFLLPSISRVDYEFGDDYRFVITSQCTQREERVVDVTTAITWRLPIPAWIARPFLAWYCSRVIKQDVDALAILGRQIERFGRTTLHTDADLLGRHITRLRRHAAEGLTIELGEQVEELTLKI